MRIMRAIIVATTLSLATGCNLVVQKLVELGDDEEQGTPATHEVAPTIGTTAEPDAVDEEHDPLPPGGELKIYDKGLRVVRSTITLPPGWRAYQDIATNPDSGENERYVLDYYGPDGELLRSMGFAMYFGQLGQRFDRVWRKQLQQSVAGVTDDVELGEPGPSDMLEKLPNVQKMLGDRRTETFEVPFSGTRNGAPVAGKAIVLHMPAGTKPPMGTYVASFAIAPEGRLEQTIETMYEIGRSEQLNPNFTRRVQQITQKNVARSRRRQQAAFAAHQARMRNRQAAFDAHQQRMKSQSAAFDRANQTWLNNFRGDGSQGGSGYTGHDQFIDSIHERETFRDPGTGRNVQRDGQYRYNYMDGQGNIIGTDDPSFEPSALPGDWKATEALRPE